MEKNIAFYISDHNMEHALRTIPILQNMLKIEENLTLYVKSGREQISLIQSYLDLEERIHFQALEMNDREIRLWDEMAEDETVFLKEEKIGLIISDMCPWIFLAADELRIKSLLLANYTWAECCEDEKEQEEYLSCYELASRMFLYDFHCPELTGYGVEYELMSMVNRPYHMDKIEGIKAAFGKPLVFAQLPKEMEIDLSGLKYDFLITEERAVTGENVTALLEKEKNIQDYVAAADYAIRPGTWTAMADVLLSNRKAAFYVSEEDPMSSSMLKLLEKRGQCLIVEKENLIHMEEVLKKLEAFSYSYDYDYYNSDYDLAKKILFAYPEKRRRNRS